jgi:hypothetical protein
MHALIHNLLKGFMSMYFLRADVLPQNDWFKASPEAIAHVQRYTSKILPSRACDKPIKDITKCAVAIAPICVFAHGHWRGRLVLIAALWVCPECSCHAGTCRT